MILAARESCLSSAQCATRRLRPYFQGHQVVVRTNHLVAKILQKPDLAERMVG